jgi:hypothetical protein
MVDGLGASAIRVFALFDLLDLPEWCKIEPLALKIALFG